VKYYVVLSGVLRQYVSGSNYLYKVSTVVCMFLHVHVRCKNCYGQALDSVAYDIMCFLDGNCAY
jgi:hypothetical protein